MPFFSMLLTYLITFLISELLRPKPDLENAKPASLGAAVAGTEAVVHLGAATSAGGLDPATAHRVNVGGAQALIDACQTAGCRRVIVLSTQHVHADYGPGGTEGLRDGGTKGPAGRHPVRAVPIPVCIGMG